MRTRFVLSIFLLSLVSTISSAAPKLIVIVVGDQIRADYVERYHGMLVADGLRRFRDEGYYFTHAAMDHAVTKTSPGHTLIGSGLYAEQSGIVSNDWYDRASGRSVSAAELIPGGARTKLKWFVGKSLAQRIHEALPASRFISVSLKDRGSLLLGGPDQDEAYWWDLKKKETVKYHEKLDWLEDFNNKQDAFVAAHSLWEPLFMLDDQSTSEFAAHAAMLQGHVNPGAGIGANFPHSLSTVEAVMQSPFADEWTEQLAEKAFDQWRLGQSSSTDVLTVSFSAVDLVGHAFGPDSREVMDTFLRLDRQVAKLMNHINKRVESDVVWVFSSDHGVTPLPEESQAQGLKAGRFPFNKKVLPHANWIKAVSEPWIYLDEDAIQRSGIAEDEAITRIKNDLLELEGVSAVYTQQDFWKKAVPPELQHSFYASRVGDLWVVLKPKYIFSNGASGTTHGQPTPDDQNVPLGFYGDDISPAVKTNAISPTCVAPTLLKLLNIPAPDLAAPVILSE